MLALTPIRQIFAIDLRTLALYRMMVAVAILADLWMRARDLAEHYSDYGLLPRVAVIADLGAKWSPSIHLMTGAAMGQALLFALAGAIALALLVGYRTRLMTILSWGMLLSLQTRSLAVSQGADMLLAALLFWGMFLPLGARFSVDAALDRRNHANSYFSAATMALLVQCMCVYFFTALLKDSKVWLPEGTAVYYALQLDYLITPFGEWLRQFPNLMHGLTYFVWCLEILAPALMFSPLLHLPLRLLGIVLLVGMHIGFFLCLEIGIFPYVSITSLLVFTPGWVWDKLQSRWATPARSRIAIYYDQPCDFCLKVCLILRTFLLPSSVSIRPAQEDDAIHQLLRQHNSWVVVDAQGNAHVRWDAVAFVFRRSVLFGWLGALFSLAWVRPMGERVYGWIAHNRGCLANMSARLLPFSEREIHPGRVTNTIIGMLLVALLIINIESLPTVKWPMAAPIKAYANLIRMNQGWNMFAPHPSRRDGWFIVRGVTDSGQPVNVLEGTAGEPDWRRPDRIADTFPTYRWRKFMMKMIDDKRPRLRLHYAKYLCTKWNRAAPRERKLAELTVYFNYERVLPDYGARHAERRVVITRSCRAPADLPPMPKVRETDDANENF